MSAWAAYGTVTNTTSQLDAARSFDVPATAAPAISEALAPAAAPRSSEREPITMSSPARASRSARPNPSSPVPPMTAMATPGSASPAHVVQLLVLHGPGQVAAFVLQALPQRLGPLPDGPPPP